MKRMNLRILLLAIFAFLQISSCVQKDEPSPSGNTPDKTPKGFLFMHLHNYIDVTEVDDYNIVYTNTYDRKIKMSKGQFYLSNFELIRLDGSVYSIPDSIVLKVQESETYEIAEVPVGNYRSISFSVGLNEQASKLPSTARHALNRQEMWFGATSQAEGFVYFNFQGAIDTTTDATGSVSEMQPFTYRLGTASAFKKITMPDKPYTVTTGQVHYVHMYADYNQLFSGIDLTKKENLNISTPSDNASATAARLVNNFSRLFVYED